MLVVVQLPYREHILENLGIFFSRMHTGSSRCSRDHSRGERETCFLDDRSSRSIERSSHDFWAEGKASNSNLTRLKIAAESDGHVSGSAGEAL